MAGGGVFKRADSTHQRLITCGYCFSVMSSVRDYNLKCDD